MKTMWQAEFATSPGDWYLFETQQAAESMLGDADGRVYRVEIRPATDGGTTTAEFGAQPQLVDAAKQIVARLATLREFVRRVREIDTTVTRNTTVSLYRAIQWLDAELEKKVSE